MRVLIFTEQTDRPEAELYCRLKQRGVEILVYGNEKIRHREILADGGVPYLPIHFSGRIDPSAIIHMRRVIKKFSPDIIHYFSSRALSNGMLASTGITTKQIAYRGTSGHLSRWDPSCWLTFFHPKLDHIITVSKSVRDYLAAQEIPVHKISPIVKGHDPRWYRCTPKKRSELNIPDNAFLLSCTANVRPVKGVRYQLEAIRELLPDIPVHYMLIGDVRDSKVSALLSELRSSERVHPLGYREDAAAYVAASDAFLMTSIDREGICKAVVEAMALGVPPIVTDVGGFPEIVQHEKSGLLVPPRSSSAIKEAILKLYNDRILLAKLKAGAREKVESEISIEKTVAATHALYQELLR